MADESLVEALEREHREIDAGIEAYTGTADVESLQQAMSALRRHIYLEEEFLFPPLREAGMFGPLMVMLREHGELWRGMDALTRMLEEGQGGDPATSACRTLLAQLAAHNAKEEPIIYPQAGQVLSPVDAAELQEFIHSGEFPAGWVCERASA
jgi:regulator of cell morphogenesis and NO signaling